MVSFIDTRSAVPKFRDSPARAPNSQTYCSGPAAKAESFYVHHGFVPFGDMPGTLVLPALALNPASSRATFTSV
jgi:hypothetical protein